MEYLQIFDKDKNMLDDIVERSNKWKLDDGKYFMVVLLFIENNEGKFLFQRTSIRKGHVYATTGGHTTKGDNGLKTVIKEVKEELGLDVVSDDLTLVETLIHEQLICEVYYMKKDVDIDALSLQKSEVESVSWLSREELDKLINTDDFRKGNIKPFKDVIEFLNK